jgi:hypothetical protein
VDSVQESGSVSVRILLSHPFLRIAGGYRDRVQVEYVVRERKATEGKK